MQSASGWARLRLMKNCLGGQHEAAQAPAGACTNSLRKPHFIAFALKVLRIVTLGLKPMRRVK
jgi:hypothetical protein